MSRTWITRAEVLERLRGQAADSLRLCQPRPHRRAARSGRPPPQPLRRRGRQPSGRPLAAGRRAPPPVPGGQASRNEAVVDFGRLGGDRQRVYYRGRDAIELADKATLEQARAAALGRRRGPLRRPEAARSTSPSPAGPHRACSRPWPGAPKRTRPRSGAASGRYGAKPPRCSTRLVDAVAGPGPRLYLHQRLARAWKVDERGAQLIRRALVLSAEGS